MYTIADALKMLDRAGYSAAPSPDGSMIVVQDPAHCRYGGGALRIEYDPRLIAPSDVVMFIHERS